MDAKYTGQIISERRKDKGLSQKALAEKLNVTDKAVSKWERGVNFPDLYVLEKLSIELDCSIVEILGMSELSHEESVKEVAVLAKEQNKKVINDFIIRGIITVLLGMIVMAANIYTSKVLDNNRIYGFPQMASLGMIGFIGIIISNGVVSIRNGIIVKHK